MVTQGARLCLLEVGVGGNRDRGVGLGELAEPQCEPIELPNPLRGRSPEIEPEIERNLIIAGPGRMQLPGHRSDHLAQSTLDRAVHVLVGFGEGE